ncbi:MAG: hypothetical protein J6S31_05355 [Lachnospiraceae bacterium]|nr:hypothetical protein [Lachnospiraceae bacterium]
MTDAEKLTMLKVDLGISVEAYDTRLSQYIQVAKQEIGREGITLSEEDLDDNNLVIMYAAYMWRKRESGDGMPRMLRYALNNRLFKEKMEE